MEAYSSFTACCMDDNLSVDILYSILRGNYEGVEFPLYFKQFYGTKKLWDILNASFGFWFISKRLKNVLEENRFTGWQTYPIKLFYKNMKPIEGYYGFSVVGRCGPIDYSKSEIIKCVQPETGYTWKAYKVWYIGLDEWDGSDFFFPGETRHTIVTQKVVDVLKGFNRQIKFTNLADETTDCADVRDYRRAEKNKNKGK